jgi:hypothetical protein
MEIVMAAYDLDKHHEHILFFNSLLVYLTVWDCTVIDEYFIQD